jgi:uncharacterized protein (DUF58 family)
MARAVERNITPDELAKVGDLSLLAQVLVAGQRLGMHRSPHAGNSVEFSQYRPYAQGDDPRFVDWKRYGRTDRLHIKEFHEETNLRCTLLLDCSASMGYGTSALTKFRYGQILAASLVWLLTLQHDEAALVAYEQDICCHIPHQRRAHQIRRLLAALERLKPAGATATGDALGKVGDMMAPRGMIVLISDLLQPLERVATQLRALRARRHDVLVFQLADVAEETLPFTEAVTLLDPEGGQEQLVDVEQVREAYLKNRAAHFEEIRAVCLACEIDYMSLRTDRPLDAAFRHFLDRRTHALLTKSSRAAGSVGQG